MPEQRPLRINCILACYIPGFKGGGPIKSISELTNAIGAEFDFRVFTLDRDLGDSHAYPNVPSLTWQTVGNASVYYIPPRMFRFLPLLKILRNNSADILYLNSFFNFRTSILPLILLKAGLVRYRKVILAPRGEFSPNALLQRQLKKKLFLLVSRITGLHRGVIWQASSSREMGHIQATLGISDSSIVEAPNLSSGDAEQTTATRAFAPREPGPVRVVFLSRISPFKNLDFLLTAMSKCAEPIEFTIYGPIECETFWRACNALIAKLPSHITVSYAGEIPSEKVAETFGKHDVFFFPTKGENFGHVIHESLSAGTCVVVSDQTPWHETNEQGISVIPINSHECWTKELEKWARRTQDQLANCRFAALSTLTVHREERRSIERNRRLFSLDNTARN
jgi:glycosyltransferase involved in cell wall biosynthesis